MSLQHDFQLHSDEFDFQLDEDLPSLDVDLPNAYALRSPAAPKTSHNRQQLSRESSDGFLDVEYPELTAEDFDHQTTEMLDLKLENNYLENPFNTIPHPNNAPRKRKSPYQCHCGKGFRKAETLRKHTLKQHRELTNGINNDMLRKEPQLLPQPSRPNLSEMVSMQQLEPGRRQRRRGKGQLRYKKQLQTEYDQFGNKVYITKRIYFCGRCFLHFKFNEELALHLKQSHEDIPDGTVYGLKQQTLLRFFKLNQFIRKREESEYKYRCGCGKTYICSSSLRCHISTKHNNNAPEGTIGALPHWSRKKYSK